MTETRDNFRKFTDAPNADMHYIGNNLVQPEQFYNQAEGHYLTSYKRDFGEEGEAESDGEEIEIDEAANAQQKASPRSPKSRKRRSKTRSKSPGSRIKDRQGTPKQKKLDIKRWVYERNKAKYGKPLIDKSKLSKKERKELDRLEKAISVSRWNPDTHTKSMHGKPIWHSYGNKNTDPTVGGVVYGHYLLSHNINPHAGDNKPLYHQVYNSAHNKAFENGKPEIPVTRDLPESPKISKEELNELKNRNPIMPGPSSKHLKRHVKQLDLLQEP